ncbi:MULTISPECIES: hypothetical protein [Actinomadura]|uniref:ATP-binding protein n=1 Tax=Actinomadura yumaensis TaxID=111807 RepID=A0ABW2D139_9ACTN|nr:hypothetical protein [Actinomadura sp. J1-007]MWK39183.1 hypothetical protein [Actinomadura sp. J1-007]
MTPCGPLTAHITFVPRTSTVGCARRVATDALHAWRIEHVADEVRLIVSELVTNSRQALEASADACVRLGLAYGRRS